MSAGRLSVEVYAHWQGLAGPQPLGLLHANRAGVDEIFEFELSASALAGGSLTRVSLDPRIVPRPGRQYPAERARNFGAFLDSSPDRWGRLLMQRRHERAHRQANGPQAGPLPPLRESDYLLGVHDAFRVGALRFALPQAPAGAPVQFLAQTSNRSAPPFVRLRELEQASRAIESSDLSAQELDGWLRILLAPGGSLGGARPKASVADPQENLWIAKFPSYRDQHDVGAWEAVAHALAKACELDVPDAWARRFASDHHTFVVRRFDRPAGAERLHFASAMTLTDHVDGDDEGTGAGYLEIAAVLISQGSATAKDLQELWSRIVFNMCVSNADDHLRNHGFLLEPGRGWRLAPAFDMNPVFRAQGLKLNVSDSDNALDLKLALSVAPYFRVSKAQATQRIDEIRQKVAKWPILAKRLGIDRAEQERMRGAFALAH